MLHFTFKKLSFRKSRKKKNKRTDQGISTENKFTEVFIKICSRYHSSYIDTCTSNQCVITGLLTQGIYVGMIVAPVFGKNVQAVLIGNECLGVVISRKRRRCKICLVTVMK